MAGPVLRTFALMLEVATDADAQHLANQRDWPHRFKQKNPGVLHSDSLAKYAVAFLRCRAPSSRVPALRVVVPSPSAQHSPAALRHLATRPSQSAAPSCGLLGYPQHPRRHRRLLPSLDQPDGLQLELHRVPRAAVRFDFLAPLSFSLITFSASATEDVFRAQGHRQRTGISCAAQAQRQPDQKATVDAHHGVQGLLQDARCRQGGQR